MMQVDSGSGGVGYISMMGGNGVGFHDTGAYIVGNGAGAGFHDVGAYMCREALTGV